MLELKLCPFRKNKCTRLTLPTSPARKISHSKVCLFLVADTLPCQWVGRSVHNIFELRAVFALLPNCPRLDCRVSGLVNKCIVIYEETLNTINCHLLTTYQARLCRLRLTKTTLSFYCKQLKPSQPFGYSLPSDIRYSHLLTVCKDRLI